MKKNICILIELLSWYLNGGTEESHENISIAGVPDEIGTEHLSVMSTALSLHQPARWAVRLFILKLKCEVPEIYSLGRSPSKYYLLQIQFL
jgi:hypothetical protein